MDSYNYSTKALEFFDGLFPNGVDPMSPVQLTHTEVYRLLNDHAVKFMLPETGALIDFKNYSEAHYSLMRLPYDVCAFELVTHGVKSILVAVDSKKVVDLQISLPSMIYEGSLEGRFDGIWFYSIFFEESKKCWVLMGSVVFIPYDVPCEYEEDGTFRITFDEFNVYSKDFERVENDGFAKLPFVTAILEATAMLNCENVEVVSNAPPAKLNLSRMKKGKKPLFRYHTLKVGNVSYHPISGDHKETNGSISTHLRRGHIRRLKDKKVTWVRPAIINRDADTRVDKSYQL